MKLARLAAERASKLTGLAGSGGGKPQAKAPSGRTRKEPAVARERPPTPQKLPNASYAEIAPSKLRDFALNPDAEAKKGCERAQAFRRTLGFEQRDWEDLRAQILKGVLTEDVQRTAQKL